MIYYTPVFLLYELSSPFLNIHWFCDKVDLTGSTIQAVNGAFLTATFFGCRLIWGNISSILVFYDIFRGVYYGNSRVAGMTPGGPKNFTPAELLAIVNDEQGQRWAFAGEQYIPVWLAAVYLTSNLTLNSLNIFWFGKMIQTIRKRFDPPFGTKGVGPDEVHWEPQEKKKAAAANLAASAADAVEGDLAITAQDHEHLKKKSSANGSKSFEVAGTRTLRTRKA